MTGPEVVAALPLSWTVAQGTGAFSGEVPGTGSPVWVEACLDTCGNPSAAAVTG